MNHLTLGGAFATRRNSLNAMRLVLAACVIISHSSHVGGYGPEPELMGWTLGMWALLGFFGISGYLVTMSRLTHGSSIRYFQARLLRILPGLWVSVTVVAFVIAPATAALSGRQYRLNEAAEFALRNALMLTEPLGPLTIGETLADIPDSQVWNGPLWTLFWEVFCYLIVGLFGAVFRQEIFRIAVIIFFAIGTAALAIMSQIEDLGYWATNGPVTPITAFFAGSIIFCFKNRLVLTMKTCTLLLIATGAAMTFELGNYLSILPLIILLLMLSFIIPMQKFGSKFDISYGMYIYGWPIQQCLALAGLHMVTPVAVFGVVSLCATLPMAWFSCVFVERPAQHIGKGSPRFRPLLRSVRRVTPARRS